MAQRPGLIPIMMKLIQVLSVGLCCSLLHGATITVGPWTPIFQGIDLASGQQAPGAGEQRHEVRCLRVDLQNPDVRLFTTPHCTNGCVLETLAENTGTFLEKNGVQAAINGGFYDSSSGANDTPLNTPDDVEGLAISRGAVVSPADDNSRRVAMLFTTNNQAFFVPTNTSPGTNTTGIYTAVSGNYPLLIHGANVGVSNASDLDPRSAIGLSQDRRYLYLMTLDGRQPGWSDGADFYNTALWLARFGAYDGANIDGGGSTTMCMADCQGKSVRVNRSSFVAAYGRERNIGHNFGVYAPALVTDIKDLTVTSGRTTATLTWRTDLASTAQVQYGPTNYSSTSALDPRLLKNHAITLTGLQPGSNYVFRVISTNGAAQYIQDCGLATITSVTGTQLFGLNKVWRYTSNNVDAVNWKAPAYNDQTATWLGNGPGLLVVRETSSSVAPINTIMPPVAGTIPRTYSFRTHFTNSSAVAAGASLILSNYVDDGAVFYLNGTEIGRLRMDPAPTAITYASLPVGVPCFGLQGEGDAQTVCPDVFTISGPLLTTNLVQGDNVLAVEVHNNTGSDLVFGSALILNTPITTQPRLNLLMERGYGTLYWTGDGYTLQQSANLSSTSNWQNVSGSATQSIYMMTNSATLFYRLKN